MSDNNNPVLHGTVLHEGSDEQEMANQGTPNEPVADKTSQTAGEAEQKGFVATLSRWVAIAIPPGGILASSFNLASSSIGAGILGLPEATNKSGLVMAFLYLLFVTLASIYSMYLLAIAAEKTQIRSFEGSAKALMGNRFAMGVAGIRAFHAFAGCVAYVISVGDIISAIVDHSPSAPEFLGKSVGNKMLTTMVWLVAMLPLVIPRHIDTLRHLSTFAVSFMIYFVIVIIVHSCMNGLSDNWKNTSVGKSDDAPVILFNSGNQAIEGLGVFMFAYVCQITAYEVFWDMKNRTIMRYTIASTIGMTLCFILYAAVSFFGYMDFGKTVTGSILLMYDPVDEPQVMVAFIGVLTKLVASYAILSLALRNSIYHMVGWDDPDEVPFKRHCMIVVALAVFVLLSGLFIPKISTVLGFAGSISGGSLGFVLPALYMMYAGGFTWQKVGAFNYICTYLMLLSGVVAIIFGTGATIHGTIVGD